MRAMNFRRSPAILIVEDNPDDVELLQRAFERTHVIEHLVIARDGVEAIEYLLTANPLPHLVLLDLKLPRLGGLEVLARIRANPITRLQPVVLFTSSNEQADRINGYNLGANSCVRKPIEFSQLVETAQQLVSYWVRLNEAPPDLLTQRPAAND
jgi:two-component system, response regulator